jgi:hypothetical protein
MVELEPIRQQGPKHRQRLIPAGPPGWLCLNIEARGVYPSRTARDPMVFERIRPFDELL